MTKEKNEREIGLFIKTRQDSTIRSKVTRKKTVKFAICLIVYLFVYFSLNIEAFRISASLILFQGLLGNGSELLLSSKPRSQDAT